MAQISFTWPSSSSYEPLDFIVTAANREAVHFMDQWPAGHAQAGLLSGPPGSGKTHLAHRWASRTGAVFMQKDALGTLPSAALWQGRTHAVLEDMHADVPAEALFHVLRHGETHGLHLLLTSPLLPRDMPFTLPDLQSRLRGMPAARLNPPDEALLKAYLVKGFSDRQMRVGDEVIAYLLKRMERSFIRARQAIETIAAAQEQTHQSITIPFLKSIGVAT